MKKKMYFLPQKVTADSGTAAFSAQFEDDLSPRMDIRRTIG